MDALRLSVALREIAKSLDGMLETAAGEKVQFSLFVWPTTPGGQVQYVASTTDREAVSNAMLEGLPVNAEATKIYRCNWLTQHPKVDPDSMPAIHGPAVLFGRRVWF